MKPASSSQIETILQDPGMEMAVVGPRPVTARPVSSFAWRLVRAAVKTSQVIGTGIALTLALMPTGLPQSALGLATSPVQPQVAPAKNQWVNMPTSVFMEVGRQSDGRLSISKMFRAWQAAGMDPAQASQTLGQLQALSPVLLGRLDPILEREIVRDASRVAWELESRMPTVADRLITGEMAPGAQDPEVMQAWADVREEVDRSRATMLNEVDLPRGWNEMPYAPAGTTMSQARQSLEKTVSMTGLKSLRLPISYWERPATLYRASMALRTANTELQQVTGLEGQVLGLGGRLELSIAQPKDAHREDGRYTLGRAGMDLTGRLQAVTGWTSLGHEWFHAFDFTLGAWVLTSGSSSLLSENLQPLRLRNSGTEEMFDAMGQARHKIFEVAPEWIAARKMLKSETGQDYWTQPGEVMAYAFAAMVHGTDARILAAPDQTVDPKGKDGYWPGQDEVAAQSIFFNKVFEAAGPLRLTASASAPTLSQWRDGKQAVSPPDPPFLRSSIMR